jgi:hypothetical protein
MSAAASAGKTYGGGLPVLVDAGFIPERNFADVTKVYTDRLKVRDLPTEEQLRRNPLPERDDVWDFFQYLQRWREEEPDA